ncbi:hypothetical protein B0T20DRAFT_437277 [Sordaria brevicollis]|uniref:Uncharacterized protein n=1 Tax=Sordaria brevicollis TaxID=83679 RepID=A0AAE0PE72_SORBR|nr:hypothetical protein B0T20DRAFT_437277 [Sordaria brevicollis]
MDTSSGNRFTTDPQVLKARQEVERLLDNSSSSSQPPWGENLKVLVKWATEYQGTEVQPEQQPQSRTPEHTVHGMFLPEHLRDFWNSNPKWVTDYFVNALRYPRLEVIVRAIMQEHLAGQKSYLTTVTTHVNPKSRPGEIASPTEEKTQYGSASEAGGEASGMAVEAEASVEEKANNDDTDEEKEGPSNAKASGLSDADKAALFSDLQDVLRQHIHLKGFLGTFWTMLHEYCLIEHANHMLYMERLRTASSGHHHSPLSDRSLVFPKAPQSSYPRSQTQSDQDAEEEEEEEAFIKNRTAELLQSYPLCPQEGLIQLAKCEKIFYDKIVYLNDLDEKMHDRADELIRKENELLGRDMQFFLKRLMLQTQERALEQREKEVNERKEVLREREERARVAVMGWWERTEAEVNGGEQEGGEEEVRRR